LIGQNGQKWALGDVGRASSVRGGAGWPKRTKTDHFAGPRTRPAAGGERRKSKKAKHHRGGLVGVGRPVRGACATSRLGHKPPELKRCARIHRVRGGTWPEEPALSREGGAEAGPGECLDGRAVQRWPARATTWGVDVGGYSRSGDTRFRGRPRQHSRCASQRFSPGRIENLRRRRTRWRDRDGARPQRAA